MCGGVEGGCEWFFVVYNDEDATADETGSETIATLVGPGFIADALKSNKSEGRGMSVPHVGSLITSRVEERLWVNERQTCRGKQKCRGGHECLFRWNPHGIEAS